MATMGAAPHVTHVPTMTAVMASTACAHFIGKWPADTVVTPLTRTVGETDLVDELNISSHS